MRDARPQQLLPEQAPGRLSLRRRMTTWEYAVAIPLLVGLGKGPCCARLMPWMAWLDASQTRPACSSKCLIERRDQQYGGLEHRLIVHYTGSI